MSNMNTSDTTRKNTGPTIPLEVPNGYDMQTALTCTYLVTAASSMCVEWIAAGSPQVWTWTPGNLCSVTSGIYSPGQFSFSPLIWSAFEWGLKKQREPFGFVATLGGTAYLVFRGSQTDADFGMDVEDSLVDYTPPGGKPSSGLQTEKGFTSVFTGIDWTGTPFPSPDQYSSLVITGHSLGSTLATLAVPLALNAGWPAAKVLNYPQASPMVGNTNFANYYTSLRVRTFRLVNSYDAVPKLPPPKKGYVPVGMAATFGADYGAEANNHDPCCCYAYALLNPKAPYNQGLSSCMGWHKQG